MNLNYGEHILTLGKTGGGKTVMLQYLTTRFNRAIVFDIEQLDGWEYLTLPPDCKQLITSNPEDIIQHIHNNQNFRIIIRPTVQNIVGANLFSMWDRIMEIAFNHKAIALVCDEVAFTQPNYLELTPYTQAVIMLGRKRYLSLVVSTRRNQEIHKAYISQSNHYFVYRLQPYDIIRYKEFIPEVEKSYGLPPYHCLYIHESGETKILKPCPITVDIGKKRIAETSKPKPRQPPANQPTEPIPDPEPTPDPNPNPDWNPFD